MDSYILKALKRLRKEAPRRLKDFRLSCDELICKNVLIDISSSNLSKFLELNFSVARREGGA
jgi:hypothetical protein